MYSSEIRDILMRDVRFHRLKTKVVCSKDEIFGLQIYRPGIVVVNSLPSSETIGGHWICLYFPNASELVYYFDPLGNHMYNYGIQLTNPVITVTDRAVQKTPICGEWCLYFVAKMLIHNNCHSAFKYVLEASDYEVVNYLQKSFIEMPH